jgi:hypothetical protein
MGGCYVYGEQTLSCKTSGSPTATVGGGCAPSGGVMIADVSWKTTHGVCNLTTAPGGCTDGTCYLEDAGARVCFAKVGPHQPCPSPIADWTQIKAYSGQNDGRVCSACGCGSPSAATCSPGTYTFFVDPTCNVAPLAAGSSCQQMSPNNVLPGESVSYTPGQVIQAASCPASGGTPSGEFVGTGDVTLCCKE